MAAAATWTLPAGQFDRATIAATGRASSSPARITRCRARRSGRSPPPSRSRAASSTPPTSSPSCCSSAARGSSSIGSARSAAWSRGSSALSPARTRRDPGRSRCSSRRWARSRTCRKRSSRSSRCCSLLGRGLGIDAVSVVAMSAGAAMIGSAFGPTNPFQAGIAMKLAQTAAARRRRLRLAMFVAASRSGSRWTMRHAARTRSARRRRLDGAAVQPSQRLANVADLSPRRSRRWPRTSTARSRSAGDSTSCRRVSSSPACVAGLCGGLGVAGTDARLSRRNAESAAGGDAHRRRAQHLARARATATSSTRSCTRSRAARARAGGVRGAADDSRPGAHPRRSCRA